MTTISQIALEVERQKLGEELEKFSTILCKDIMNSKKLTKEKPISSKTIVEYYNKALKTNLDRSQIRKVIHYLRVLGNDIGSNSEGYYPIRNAKEYDETIEHELSRLRNQAKVLKIAIQRRKALREGESELFQHPTMKALKEKFNIQQ